MKKAFKTITILGLLLIFITGCASTEIIDTSHIRSREDLLIVDGVKLKIVSERIEISGRIPHWFFTGNNEEIIKNELLNAARIQIGEYIVMDDLIDVRIDDRWSPMSLLMYFDMFGYVTNYTAECNVITNRVPIIGNNEIEVGNNEGLLSVVGTSEPDTSWKNRKFFIGTFVDEFGDEVVKPEGDKYARTTVDGQASNSAGTHDCIMNIDVYRRGINISGWEYKDQPVKIGKFKIKAPDGTIFIGMNGALIDNQYLGSQFSDLILHIEQDPGVYKFSAYEDSLNPTSFVFSVDLTDAPSIVEYFGWHHYND